MESLPQGASLIIVIMPLLGIGLLAVVLAALIANREKLIVPGAVSVVILAASIGVAMEYGPRMTAAKAPPQKPSVPEADYDETEPTLTRLGQGKNEDLKPSEKPAAAKPEKNKPASRKKGRQWIPATEYNKRPEPDNKHDGRDGRRTVVVAPPPQTPVGPSTPVRTKPEPKPEPAKPAATTPPREVAMAPTPAVPAAPKAPAASAPVAPAPARSGDGKLVVKIKGPVLETSQSPAASPHILVIVAGANQAMVKPPTRTSQTHQDDDPRQPVLAYTYFWENLTITFQGLEPGHYFILIDSGLDSPQTHQAAMQGAGQGQNDYNGAVEVKAGQTTTIEFGAKNWNTGKLQKIR